MSFFKVLLVLQFVFVYQTSFSQYEVRLSNNYPPFNFINEQGELVGFNVDIINAILELNNVDVNIESGDWKTINEALDNGEIDAIAGSYYPGLPDSLFLYTRSVFNSSHSFFYNRDHLREFTINQFRLMKAPIVAMHKNEVLINYVQYLNPTTEFLFINDYNQLYKALQNKDVTCVFGHRSRGSYSVGILGFNNIEMLENRILERSMGFKVSNKSPQIVEMLNNGFEVIMANGEYEKIVDKWITSYTGRHLKLNRYIRILSFVAIIVSLLILLLIVINRILQSKVRSKTLDLQQQLDLNSKMMIELEEQKNRAEQNERMKTAFLANMSHEIRTPMHGILGFTELLKTNKYDHEEQGQFIDIIEKSGNRMLNTINNIVDISKLESGMESPLIKRVNIDQMLSELKHFFIHEANSKGIELRIEQIKSDSLNELHTDEYMLNSIFTNLIKNAIKFTNKGVVRICYAIGDKLAEFWIQDTGIGIEDNKQETVFDQFVQADVSYSREYEGSGLGLSIIKGYIDLLEGKIMLKSKKDVGSTFYVQIPNLNKPEKCKVSSTKYQSLPRKHGDYLQQV